jgi:DNA helicase TIP49 (TBP-interacting protein)
VLEHRKSFLGKRIDIASDEVTGEQAAKILSNELGQRIRYVHISLEQVYQANENVREDQLKFY